MSFSLLLDNRQLPGPKRQFGGLGDRLAVEQVGSGGVGIGRLHLRAGVVEVVVQPLAQAIDAVLHVDRGRQLLVGAGEAGLLQRALEHRGLQLLGEIGSLIEQGSHAELVLGDCRPLSEKGVIVIRERLFARSGMRNSAQYCT